MRGLRRNAGLLAGRSAGVLAGLRIGAGRRPADRPVRDRRYEGTAIVAE